MTLVASETRRPGEPLVPGARPIRSVPARSSGASAEGREFGRWFLGSALYSLTLGYGTPRSFFAVAPDSWPGDPALGQRLLGGEFAAHGSAGPVSPESEDPPWQRAGAAPLWIDALNGFAADSGANLQYGDGMLKQMFVPDFDDYTALLATLRQALGDQSLGLAPLGDGTVLTVFNGTRYLLVPQWSLVSPSATTGKPAWWVENGVIYVKNADGTAQGFVVK